MNKLAKMCFWLGILTITFKLVILGISLNTQISGAMEQGAFYQSDPNIAVTYSLYAATILALIGLIIGIVSLLKKHKSRWLYFGLPLNILAIGIANNVI